MRQFGDCHVPSNGCKPFQNQPTLELQGKIPLLIQPRITTKPFSLTLLLTFALDVMASTSFPVKTRFLFPYPS
jgi:hypothetical protein